MSENIFSVDYGKQLADMILRINREHLDALEKTAKRDAVERGYVSVAMMDIQKRWNEEIAVTCREMMGHMSDTVAHYQQLAMNTLNSVPGFTRAISRQK